MVTTTIDARPITARLNNLERDLWRIARRFELVDRGLEAESIRRAAAQLAIVAEMTRENAENDLLGLAWIDAAELYLRSLPRPTRHGFTPRQLQIAIDAAVAREAKGLRA
ncbi:hypothetical protein [Humibacter albus]|uniref:hypothetical protein n=1 Tax=Humibacter albus TaxID=427754 RepID=UPI0003B38A42|nr:hypothetical protein [Humibacter albus]